MIFLELISESRWLQNVKIVVLGLAKPFNSEHAYLWAIFFKALREAQCLNTHRKVVFGRETPGNSHESNDFSRADFRILVHQNVKFLVLGCGKNHSIPSTRIYERFFSRLYVKRNAWIRTEKWLFAKKLQGNSHESNDFSRADFRIEVAPDVKIVVLGLAKPFNSEHAYLWAIFLKALREAQCLNTHRKVVFGRETPGNSHESNDFSRADFRILVHQNVKFLVLGCGKNHSIPSTRIYERFFSRLYVKRNAWIRTEKWLFAKKLQGNSHESNDFSRADFRIEVAPVKIVVLGLAKPFNSEHAYLWAIFFKALREAQCLNTHRKVVFGRETPGNSHESNDFSRADFRILVHQNVKFLVLGCGKNHSIPSTRIYERFFSRLYVKRNAWIRTEKWLFAKKLQGNSHESNDFSRADFRIEVAPVKIVVLGLAKPFNSEHAYLWAIFFKALREAQCLNTHRKVVFGRETPGNSHESNDFSRADFRILVHQNVKFLVLGCGKNHSIPSTRIYERFFWRLYVKRNAWIRTEKWLFAKKLQGNSHESNDFSRADFRIEVAPVKIVVLGLAKPFNSEHAYLWAIFFKALREAQCLNTHRKVVFGRETPGNSHESNDFSRADFRILVHQNVKFLVLGCGKNHSIPSTRIYERFFSRLYVKRNAWIRTEKWLFAKKLQGNSHESNDFSRADFRIEVAPVKIVVLGLAKPFNSEHAYLWAIFFKALREAQCLNTHRKVVFGRETPGNSHESNDFSRADFRILVHQNVKFLVLGCGKNHSIPSTRIYERFFSRLYVKRNAWIRTEKWLFAKKLQGNSHESNDFSRADFRIEVAPVKIVVLGLAKPFNSEHAYLWAIFLKALREAQCLNTHRKVVFGRETPGNSHESNDFSRADFRILVHQNVKFLVLGCGKNHSIPSTRIYERFFSRLYVKRNAWIRTEKWLFAKKLQGNSHESNDFSRADFRIEVAPVKIVVLGLAKPFNSEHAYLWAIFFKALREAQCLNTHRKVVFGRETPGKFPRIEWFFSSWFQNLGAPERKISGFGVW